MAEPGEPKPARLAWWPEERRRSSDKEPLSRTQIVAAAIKLIDAEGLQKFSMRRLGQELGAGATSFYWHVKDKDQLIDLVLDDLAGSVEIHDDPTKHWRERIEYVAREMHTLLDRHPRLAPLYGARLTIGPNTLRVMDLLLGILRDGGFEGNRLMLGFSAVLSLSVAWAVMGNRDITGSDTAGKTVEELEQFQMETLLSLPPDEFPNLVSIVMAVNPAEVTEGDQFEYALKCMLDGMERELAASKG